MILVSVDDLAILRPEFSGVKWGKEELKSLFLHERLGGGEELLGSLSQVNREQPVPVAVTML